MKEIEGILKKIEEETAKKIEKLKKEAEEKKQQLKERYQKLLEEKKQEIDKKFLQTLELEKKRIYTEKFISYNKEIEAIKHSIFRDVFEKVKNAVLSLDKQRYYSLIKSILIKNIFVSEVNSIIFDTTNKLNFKEKQQLISEVISEVSKINKDTKIEISEKQTLDFGIRIVSGKKSKEYNLDNIVEVIKPKVEKEINKALNLVGI